jgi:PrtD family type I secretion system ABC transporter
MQDLFSPLPKDSTLDLPVQKILRQCRQAFIISFVITFICEILSITPMLYMMNVMDYVLHSGNGTTLFTLTVLVIVFYIFWSAVDWINSRLLIRLSLRIDWELAANVFDASFRKYIGQKSMNVQQLLDDVTSLRQFFTGQPAQVLMKAPFALIFIVIATLFHPLLAAFALIATLLMLVISYLTIKITSPIMKVSQDAQAEATRVAAASLRQAETTLALGMLSGVRNRWHEQHKKYLSNQENASEAKGLTDGLNKVLQKSIPSLQMALGAYLAMEGLITAGMVMGSSMLISKAIAPIQGLIGGWKDIIAARSAYDRLNSLLTEDLKTKSSVKLPPPEGRLEVVDAVGVPPGHDKAVITDLNFELDPGQVLAIVGPSAAGKTSLSKMLLGLWDPSQGSVRLDGVKIADWDHDDVGPLVGYVPQEISFFEGTVAENIARLGEIVPEKVIEAAKLIEMHEVILGFPKGYDTIIGDSGFAPSGGQRQRLAIARAIYGMPKFVVMDEPNSNLDELGETALINCVLALKQNGGTVIITTHRPRLVNVVDMMLVLKEGRQVAFGKAQDILEAVRRLQVIPAEGEEGEEGQDNEGVGPKGQVGQVGQGVQNEHADPSNGPGPTRVDGDAHNTVSQAPPRLEVV